jgi:hypothetical protein
MLDVMACFLRSVGQSVKWAAMIATIAETIGAYRNLDRRHETIAPFLPVQMRTGLIQDREPVGTGSEIVVQN